MTTSGKPYKTVRGTRNSQFAFYLDDCLNVFRELEPRSVDVIVTSPPYNLGIRYNKYEDSLNQTDYLEWTGTWVAAAARVLKPHGSLFLNVGTRPSDPWTALDVAQAARAHLRLQNIIHWVKSIAIDQESTGAAAGLTRDLAVGHYKPINSDRFLNDCHEFVFHFTPEGDTRLDRLALGVPYQDQSNITRWQSRRRWRALPRQHVVHPLRNDPAPGSRPPAPGDVPVAAAGTVHPAARLVGDRDGHGSVHGAWQHRGRLRAAGREFRRLGNRRDVSGRGGRTNHRRRQNAGASCRCAAKRG